MTRHRPSVSYNKIVHGEANQLGKLIRIRRQRSTRLLLVFIVLMLEPTTLMCAPRFHYPNRATKVNY